MQQATSEKQRLEQARAEQRQGAGNLFDESKSYGFRLLRAGRTPCHPASTSAPPILNAQQQRGRFQLGERLLQCISPATVPACRETPVLFSLMFSLSYTLDFAGLFAGRNTCSKAKHGVPSLCRVLLPILCSSVLSVSVVLLGTSA